MTHPPRAAVPTPWWAAVALLMVLGSAAYARLHVGAPTGAAPLNRGGFESSATLAPEAISPGTGVAIRTTITSRSAASVLVDLEMHDATGRKVYQAAFDGQLLSAGAPTTFAATWAVPPDAGSGVYRLAVGIFTPGWGTLQYWSDNAGVLEVNDPG